MQPGGFDQRAKEWDALPRRVQNALEIARAIQLHVQLQPTMQVVDFGVGTGLLGLEVAKKVQKLYGIDTSSVMLEEFQKKKSNTCNIEAICKDVTKEECSLKVDGIISSMTLHHIENIPQLFEKFYTMLKKDGFIALADLASEDGSFHLDNTGVYHFGFSCEYLSKIAKETGFKSITCTTTHTIEKPHKSFDVILLFAKK